MESAQASDGNLGKYSLIAGVLGLILYIAFFFMTDPKIMEYVLYSAGAVSAVALLLGIAGLASKGKKAGAVIGIVLAIFVIGTATTFYLIGRNLPDAPAVVAPNS